MDVLASPYQGAVEKGSASLFPLALLPRDNFDSLLHTRSGNRVAGATAVSDSGFSYAMAPVGTVPEPTALVILGAGLACLRGVRRRRT